MQRRTTTSLLSDGHRTTKLKKPTTQASSMPRKPTKTSPKTPAFCKVLGDNHFSKRLSVPDDYIKNLNRLSSEMSLRRPSGRQWTVGLKVRNEGLSFCGGGWQQFVRDNCLEFGNILVFGYDGGSTVDVKIFGRDGGCEKEDEFFGSAAEYSSGKHSERYELQSLDDKHCEDAQISNERTRKRLRGNEKLRCTKNTCDGPPKLKKNGVDASELMQGAYRTCVHCGTTNTPYWRRGPEGRNTLCNSCGIRLSRHGSADPCVAYGVHIDRYHKKKSEGKHKLLRDERLEMNQIKEEMTELELHEVGNRVVLGRKLEAETFRFYFENLWKSFSEDKRTSFTCLDCLWFSLYLNPNFKAKVLDWIKKQRIFSKKYVIVPIFSWSHWNLLIFCHFGESLQSETQKPCMLLLDSLKSAYPMRFEPDIRKFVLDIFMEEGSPEQKDLIYKIPLLVPKVPQQRNDEECGNIVLYFMKLFLEGAPENFSIEDFPYLMNDNWFAPEALDSFCQKLFSSAR